MKKIDYLYFGGKSNISLDMYEGKPVDIMPKLVKKYLVPISAAQMMEQMVSQYKSCSYSKNAELWRNSKFYLSDSILITSNKLTKTDDSSDYFSDDMRFKICLDSPRLMNINSKSPIDKEESTLCEKGGLILPEGTYNSVDVCEFSTLDHGQYLNKTQSESEILQNPIWLAFARGNKELLKAYAKTVYSKIHPNNRMILTILPRFVGVSEIELPCVFGSTSNQTGVYISHSSLIKEQKIVVNHDLTRVKPANFIERLLSF